MREESERQAKAMLGVIKQGLVPRADRISRAHELCQRDDRSTRTSGWPSGDPDPGDS